MNIKRSVTAFPWVIASSLALPLAVHAGANDWTGPYIGAHAGYGWDNGVSLDFASGASSTSFDMNGYVAGVQGGINWASSTNLVYGIGLDLAVADIDGDAACPAAPGGSCRATLDQLSTLQGRLGMPIGNALVYGTVGGVIAQIEAERVSTGVQYSDSSNETGWLAGIGGAMKLTRNLSGMAEIQYIDVGRNDYTLGPDKVSVDNVLVIMKVGANYQF